MTGVQTCALPIWPFFLARYQKSNIANIFSLDKDVREIISFSWWNSSSLKRILIHFFISINKPFHSCFSDQMKIHMKIQNRIIIKILNTSIIYPPRIKKTDMPVCLIPYSFLEAVLFDPFFYKLFQLYEQSCFLH